MTKRTLLASLSFLLCVLLTAPSFGQTPARKGGNGSADEVKVIRVDEVEAFRLELSAYYSEMRQVIGAFAAFEVTRGELMKSGVDFAANIEKAQRELAAMNRMQLLELRLQFAPNDRLATLRRLANKLNSMLQDKEVRAVFAQLDDRAAYARARQQAKSGGVEANIKPTAPSIVIPDTCPPPALTPSLADLAVIDAIVIAAELAMELLPTDFVSIIAREAFTAAVAAAQGASLAAHTFYEQDTVCFFIKWRDGMFTEFTNAQRLQIEANLANSNFTMPIGSFVLPASQGGLIEKVRDVVSDLITKMGAIGVSTAASSSLLAAADAQISAGNYKSAYQNLRDAYLYLMQ